MTMKTGRFSFRKWLDVGRWARSLRRDDAIAEILSSVLIVGLTVLMTAGLVGLLLATKPGPADPTHAEFTLTVDDGTGGWGTGDEHVALKHVGGERLTETGTVIVLSIGESTTQYHAGGTNPLDHAEEDAFDSGSGDARWVIGETWRTPDASIDVGSLIQANVVDKSEQTQIVWSSSGRAGSVSCGIDLAPPKVTAWRQTPSDVSSQTTGDVHIRATIKDTCNTVDTSSPPHLEHRINDGTNPSYTDDGAMAQGAGDRWHANISGVTWANHFSDTLEYKVTGMTDSEGNSGGSSVQRDTIQLVGTETYASSFTDRTGTSLNDANVGADDGNEAQLQEADNGTTSPALVTNTYDAGTSTSTGDFATGTNAGASDDVYDTATGGTLNPVTYPLADESGSPGTIVSVVLKAEVHGSNQVNAWYMTPCLPGGAGCGSQSPNLGTPTQDGNPMLTYNVTTARPGGGSWSVSDINGLEIEVDGDGQNAAAQFDIDHVFAEVKYRPAGSTVYNLNIQTTIVGGADGGVTNVLEGEYRAVDDDFDLYVFDFTNHQWVDVGDLTSSTADTFSHTLTSDQIDASDNVRIRFLDKTSTGTQGSLFLDYLRVVAA